MLRACTPFSASSIARHSFTWRWRSIRILPSKTSLIMITLKWVSPDVDIWPPPAFMAAWCACLWLSSIISRWWGLNLSLSFFSISNLIGLSVKRSSWDEGSLSEWSSYSLYSSFSICDPFDLSSVSLGGDFGLVFAESIVLNWGYKLFVNKWEPYLWELYLLLPFTRFLIMLCDNPTEIIITLDIPLFKIIEGDTSHLNTFYS